MKAPEVVLRHHMTVDDIDEETKKKIADIGVSEERYIKAVNKVVDMVAEEFEED